jgi:RNA polymerase sigma-70 factor (ECF subfamily)
MNQAEDTQDRTWSRLMAAAQAGDAEAYDRLLRAITPFIRSLVRRSLFDSHGVEDVVQEVLLTVHRVRHTYDPARAFSPWLAAIASRRTIDAMRRGGRIGAHEIMDEDAYRQADETFSTDAANQQDSRDEEWGSVSEAQLQQWLAALPPRQREALELLKLREMSLAEASAASGQTVGALKVGVHRAIKSLRAKLRIESG